MRTPRYVLIANPGGKRWQAYAPELTAFWSVVRLDGGFFSTRRLRRYAGADLEAVLAFLLGEGVCVQRGIRMAQPG
jgi:hypothetical protein